MADETSWAKPGIFKRISCFCIYMLFTSPLKSMLFVINFSLHLLIEWWRCAEQDNWKNPHQTKRLVNHFFYHTMWLLKHKTKSNSPPSSFHNTISICLILVKTTLVCCKFRLKCSQRGAVVHVLSNVYRKLKNEEEMFSQYAYESIKFSFLKSSTVLVVLEILKLIGHWHHSCSRQMALPCSVGATETL